VLIPPGLFGRVSLLALAACLGCSPGRAPQALQPGPSLVFPVHLAEGTGEGAYGELPPNAASTPVAPAAGAAGAPNAAPGAGSAGAPPVDPLAALVAPPKAPRLFTNDPPDPAPLRQREQYEYTLLFENGVIQLAGVSAVRFPQPVVTARKVGRYAIELWIGHELIERVRFDFPLLAAAPEGVGTRHKLYETPELTGGPYTVKVLVPASARARSARLVDRAIRRQAELSWPPAPAGLGKITPLEGPPGVSPSPQPAATSTTPPSSAAPAAAQP
jgi:hypothetical protein